MGVYLLCPLRIFADHFAGDAGYLEQTAARIEHNLVTELTHVMG